uniref:EFR3 homolog B n=1 Tax=Astyanax mexicanus TaxID=7994 RepID=A0A3B1J051_ASTMX
MYIHLLSVCGCCGALRPRYKRLVDNIFPEDPEDGLVKANMEKLTFYALSAPEKLSRDVARHRYGYVCIAMEALDQLLMACHCQSINLFVESFLTMVRKLLEADKPNLQILGTNSFVKFANIEEDTASYHRSYDFFISRFSEMCHSRIRMAGIRGLQGVVRKTVNDELQANIWDPQHMDKIVPSLLFNLQQDQIPDSSGSPVCAEGDKDGTVDLTERCLRELLGRAVYGNIKNAVKPVLMHLDNHSLWEGKSFAVRCFKIIMYSIQSQHSHLVIQQLLGHLDANSKSSATVRGGIVEVISEAAVIEASGSIGPTVLEVFNTLLKQLRLSVDYELGGGCSGSGGGGGLLRVQEERQLQESVIRTVGSFAGTLPTYQRSEVMLFIMGKIPRFLIWFGLCFRFEGSRMIQIMLLKSLLQVTVGFQTTNMLTALPSSFLDPLLSFTLMEDAEIRLLVLEILISLIDRHENQLKFSLRVLTDISVLKLKMDKCSRQDNLFMKKHSQRLYRHVYLACREENSEQQHFQSLFTLLGLICVELANEEVVVDLIRLALALQDLAVTEEALPVFNRCAVHALSAAYLNLISQLTTVPTFCQHVHEVIELRQKEFPFLLPEGVFAEKLEKVEKVEGEFLFSQSKIAETLGGSGYNSDRLVTPYIPQITEEDRLSKRKSIVDTISLQLDVESRLSPEKEQVRNCVCVCVCLTDGVCVEEQERERRRLVVERFQTAPFEEIAAHCGARGMHNLFLSFSLSLSLSLSLTLRPPPSPSGSIGNGSGPSRSVPVYDMKFPDLCVY